MRLMTVTTWNDALYKEYAYKFESTYNWSWPYIVFNEDDGMYDEIPDLKEFVERNKYRPSNDFLHDAVRFSYKVYCYCHAIQKYKDYDFIMGVDADSVFYHSMPEDVVLNNLYKENCMLTYLGRGDLYSECGFLGFNMKHPEIQNYAKEMIRMYNSDDIYKLAECHDSFIWDHVRKKFEFEKGVKNNNIGDHDKSHVQARSILGKYYDHTKGPKRKKQGFSNENQMVVEEGGKMKAYLSHIRLENKTKKDGMHISVPGVVEFIENIVKRSKFHTIVTGTYASKKLELTETLKSIEIN